jgi:hypothetical protein
MKYGYVNNKNGKHGVFFLGAETRLCSPKISETDYRESKDQISLDEVKAKATPMQLHLTLG